MFNPRCSVWVGPYCDVSDDNPRCYFLPHLHHFLSAVFIFPLPLQHFFLLCHNLRRVTKSLSVTCWIEVYSIYDLQNKKTSFGEPPLVQFPASGPDLWAGGDSPLRCSWWSWHTGSSWTRHSLWEMTRLCAASRSQRRGGGWKET